MIPCATSSYHLINVLYAEIIPKNKSSANIGCVSSATCGSQSCVLRLRNQSASSDAAGGAASITGKSCRVPGVGKRSDLPLVPTLLNSQRSIINGLHASMFEPLPKLTHEGIVAEFARLICGQRRKARRLHGEVAR